MASKSLCMITRNYHVVKCVKKICLQTLRGTEKVKIYSVPNFTEVYNLEMF